MRTTVMAVGAALALAGCDAGHDDGVSAACVSALEQCECFPTIDTRTVDCYTARDNTGIRQPRLACPANTTYGASCPPVVAPVP